MARAKKSRISVLNWMGTLLLFALPGVNLLAAIGFLIFAKSPSKKNFALAWLLLLIIVMVLLAAALLALPEQMADAADWLREVAQPAVELAQPDAATPELAATPDAAAPSGIAETPAPTVAPASPTLAASPAA